MNSMNSFTIYEQQISTLYVIGRKRAATSDRVPSLIAYFARCKSYLADSAVVAQKAAQHTERCVALHRQKTSLLAVYALTCICDRHQFG